MIPISNRCLCASQTRMHLSSTRKDSIIQWKDVFVSFMIEWRMDGRRRARLKVRFLSIKKPETSAGETILTPHHHLCLHLIHWINSPRWVSCFVFIRSNFFSLSLFLSYCTCPDCSTGRKSFSSCCYFFPPLFKCPSAMHCNVVLRPDWTRSCVEQNRRDWNQASFFHPIAQLLFWRLNHKKTMPRKVNTFFSQAYWKRSNRRNDQISISDRTRSFSGNLDRWRKTEIHCFSCSSDEYIISAFDKSLVVACANIHFTPLMTSQALQFKSISVENVRHRSISKVPLESLLDRIQLIPFQRRRRSRRCNGRSNTTKKCSLDRWRTSASRSRTVSMISERWWIRNDRNRKSIPSPCAIFGFDWNRFNCSNRRN